MIPQLEEELARLVAAHGTDPAPPASDVPTDHAKRVGERLAPVTGIKEPGETVSARRG